MERMIVQHLHTKDSGKKPSPDSIMDGELAINYVANGETLFIKNSEGEIAEFKDDKYYQKQLSEKADKTLSLTYSELVSLRDNSQLIPGQQYRITDYTCTTTQENTRSAGHQFDIIVKADSENKLNEEANAVQHTKDDIDYFANSNLSAWKIWYCLDNDTNRFAWADATNGKGVIYRMIDEWNNDVPYDFKNIQFKRYVLDANNAIATDVAKDGELNVVKAKLEVMSHRMHTSLWYYGSYVSDVYPAADENTKYVPFGDIFYNGDGPAVLCPINEANSNWFYTFSDTSFNDNTLTGQGNVYDNVVKGNKSALVTIDREGRYSFEEKENICLNDIIFIGNYYSGNIFGNDCYSNTFGNNCYYNSFEDACGNNAFGNGCGSNTFGSDCGNNTFGDYCNSNTFGNNCNSNAFGNSCYSNTFGNNCCSNTFGNSCHRNSFGNDSYSNAFGYGCNNNAFGNSCYSNTFGNNCNSNAFGNGCCNNVFGNGCCNNVFGNYCLYINFASDRTATTKYNYYQYNHFGDGCQYILFKGTETASYSQQVQNYNFSQGIQGTDSEYLTIDGKRNREYETYISKDTDGTIKESVVAKKLDKMIEISYNDLVTLRDSSKLVPGQQYRITDYTCTTAQEGTQSAGHQFDIIVTADDESTLNEVARAVKHEGDTYFDGCNLSAWKIWYSLDNDTTRFVWAMMKGKYIDITVEEVTMSVRYAETKVINDIMYELWSTPEPGVYVGTKTLEVGEYCDVISIDEGGSFIVDAENFARISDIKEVEDGKGVIYRMIDEFNNDVPYDFKNIQFYRKWDETKQLWSTISYSTAGVPCYTFSSEGDSSTTEFTDMSLIRGGQVYSNIIKAYALGNILRGLNNNCFFGNECYENTFGNECYGNTFGNYCSRNTFGNECYENTFGNECYNNTFGNECYENTFGNRCYNNTFGNECYENTFGNECYENTFGNRCYNINFASDKTSTTKYNYYQYNYFGDGCQYILFKGAETASFAAIVQNYNFSQGIQGTDSEYLTIDGKRNRTYETYISKDTDGTIKESVIAEKLDKVIEISYNDLVTLRGSSKLVSGQQYRIIDYTCTTTQANAKSAGHVFDIIVTADDESTLNEEARAALHSGDEYFSGCNLNAWKLWYCLDNDINRFAWAGAGELIGTIKSETESVSGTYTYNSPISKVMFDNNIYALKIGIRTMIYSGPPVYITKTDDYTLVVEDEYNYAKDKGISVYTVSQEDKGVIYRMIDEFNNDAPYDFKNIQFKHPNDDTTYPYYYYTFASDNAEDNTDNSLSISNNCYSNTIREYISNNKRRLNCIIFIGDHCYNNSFGNDCYNNTFGNDCNSNTFGNDCYSNTFGNGCYPNTFGNDCNSNTFGNYCQHNTFGNGCYSNTFGNGCYSNTFGNYFQYNTFEFGGSKNSFGNNCRWNTFGEGCSSNTFGNGCYSIKFASDSSSAATKFDYYQYNHFGDGCQNILFKGTETAFPDSQVQNYNFAQGLQGTSSAYLTIDGVRNLSYETKVAKNSNGELKIYCEADLIL